jgi:tetratricopeptide (TPR) repeat protein
LEPSADGPASSDDRLLQILTLARRGGRENRAKAERICQGWLADAQQPPPAVRLLLAVVQERQGKPEEARKQYQALVAGPRPDPQVILRYVDFLLRCGPPAEADKWLKQLEQLAPEDLSTLELRARWLGDQGRTAQIEPLVEPAAEKLQKRIGEENPRQEAQLCQAVGALYERIGQHSAAQRWYRRLLKLAPDGYEPLAMSLAKEGRTQEAVALCDEAGKADKSARPALRLAMVLLSGHATAEDLKRAEPALQKALDNHKDELVLLANVANIRILQGRPDEAIALYRQILQRQPRNPAVLNNLATLLSERPEPEERKEALEDIEQAIKLSGPQPDWLDTKGLILVYEGKPDQAVGLLKEAASAPHPDPRWSFHLAVAYVRLGELDKARVALEQARAGDLDHQLLTKMDRQLLADLEKKLGPGPANR